MPFPKEHLHGKGIAIHRNCLLSINKQLTNSLSNAPDHFEKTDSLKFSSALLCQHQSSDPR